MKSQFRNFYNVVGNHDTNYMGTAKLDDKEIDNLWFRDTNTGKSFYTFTGKVSDYFVFNTGTDSNRESLVESRRAEQVAWFATELGQSTYQHHAIFMHITYHYADPYPIYLMTQKIGEIISAYNARTTVTYNNVTYDYSSATGHVDYVMGGHCHFDKDDLTVGGVPCVITTNMQAGNLPTFDACYVDYDAGKLYCVRFGTGEDRTFDI